MILRKALKSGLYFYDNDLVGKGTCLMIIAIFLSTRFSSLLCDSTPKCFLPFPLIFEIISDVKLYIENNVEFILHGFAKKL